MSYWNSLAFSMIQQMLAIWSLVPLPFLKPAWTSGSSQFTYCWGLTREGNLLTQFVVVELLSYAQLFCHPRDCSPPGSSVHGIFQVKILEWVAISFSRGSSWPRDWKRVPSPCLLRCRWILYHWATREAQCTNSNAKPFQKQPYGHTKDND